MRRLVHFCIPAAILFSSLSASLIAADWPQWRGLNRDGTSPETGLLESWPEGGPHLELRIEGLGPGISSVAVVGDRIYTLSEAAEKEYVIALDRTTGERVWATPIGPALKQNPLMRWLSQRTPTVDGERLYAITSLGQLACLETSDGSVKWTKNYQEDYGAKRPSWGFCDYPLVDGDRLICTPGGQVASVVAFSKETGDEVWRTAFPSNPQPAHSATIVGEIDGLRFYVTFLKDALYAVAADDGRMLWRYDKNSRSTANSHTPLLFENHVFTSNGYGTGIALLKLRAADDELSATEVYFERIALDAFQDNTMPLGPDTCLVNSPGYIACLDLMTGEIRWRTRVSRGRGSMILAENHVYRRSSEGTIELIHVDEREPRVAGQFQIPETERQAGGTSPVISDGRLYIRDNDRLFVYDVREAANTENRPAPILVNLPPVELRKTRREAGVPHPIYLPTPHDVVARMLKEAGVDKDTTLVDLGSGDGRIVVAAAKRHGAKAIGYEIEEELVDISRKAIAEQKLEQLARIEDSDMYKADLSEVDVVAVFLYPAVLNKLKPQFEQMKPGTRIVSHQFPIPGAQPHSEVIINSEETGEEHRILLYKLPLQRANK